MSKWGNDVLKIARANPDIVVPDDIGDDEPKRKNKYGAARCSWEGIRFDSKAEMRHYADLRLLELTGHISKLELKPVFQLPGKVKYIADFRYVENGQTVVVDVKGGNGKGKTRGTITPAFRIKWKQAQELNPDMKFVIVEK